MMMPRSEAERIALMPKAEAEAWLVAAFKAGRTLEWDWPFWCRQDQHPPEGDWRIWFVMAGRGFGKTRMAAEWVRQVAVTTPDACIALVGASQHEVRAIMVEGESGLLSVCAPEEQPVFEPSLRRITWPNGAQALLYSAAEPDALRGPQHSHAWCDEIAKWVQGQAAWDNLEMTLRRGKQPRLVATSTPRPVPLVRQVLGYNDAFVSRGRSADNRANLPPSYLGAMERIYGNTRLGRQELGGELLEDAEDALWSRDLIERCRNAAVPPFTRVVIGVDPPAGSKGDACGIVVAALGVDGRAWILADASVRGLHPEGWARAVSAAAQAWSADRIVAEANNGGEMVRATLQAAGAGLPVRLVHAAHGKVARAEPVAILYEAGRVRHAGAFPALEDELCGLITGGSYQGPGRSPDRADALVWAVTELMLGSIAVPRIVKF